MAAEVGVEAGVEVHGKLFEVKWRQMVIFGRDLHL